VYCEGNFAVEVASGLEVKPTFGVAFVVGALRVAGSPDTVVVVVRAGDAVHVAGVELATEENIGLAGLGEFETLALRDGVGEGWGE
jgi:hypothetical protein